MRHRCWVQVAISTCLLLTAMGKSATAVGGVGSSLWGLVTQYRIGLDIANGTDAATVKFDTSKPGGSKSCVQDPGNDPGVQTCTLNAKAGNRSGYGLFFEPAFKRKGLFHYGASIGFGLRSLEGQLETDPQAELTPMKNMRFFLYGGVIKPYIIVGLTPAETWPDLLISLGPVAQVLAGNVEINDSKAFRVFGQGSFKNLRAYFQGEIVFVRFGDGYFSFFLSNTLAGSDQAVGDFYPGDVDGMDHFRADFSNNLVGFKLLFNFPRP